MLDPPQDREDPVCQALIELVEGQVRQPADLGAAVSDDGQVVMVVFRIDGAVVGVDHKAPWSQGWNPALWQDGRPHELDVMAIDGAGRVGYSPVEVFQVGAEAPTPGWQAFDSRQGGSLEEYTHCLRVLDNGLVLAGGASRPGPSSPLAASLVLVDREGDALWHRRFGGERSDAVFAIESGGEGRLWCAGGSYGAPWLMILDEGGLVLASLFHASEGLGSYTALLPDGEGWLAPGSTWDGSQGDWFVDRLDAQGNLLGRSLQNTPSRSEHLMAACRLKDGRLCLAGWAHQGSTSALIQLLAPDGTLLAEREFAGARALSVVAWGEGLALAGQRENGPARQAWLEVLDDQLNTRSNFLAQPGEDGSLAGLLARGPELLAVGWHRPNGSRLRQGLVMAFDDQARVQRRHSHPGGGDASLRAISLHPEGGLILAGQTSGQGSGRQDHWLLHTDLSGMLPGTTPTALP